VISFVRDLVETLEFFSESYLATLAIALVVSYLGVYVVLKRIVFLGITLAQAAAAGIALVFFVQGFIAPGGWFDSVLETYGPTVSALGVSSAGVAAFALPGEPKKLSREALLGLGYSFFAGVSILLVWWSPKGVDELKNLLAGDVLFAHEHLRSLLVGLGLVAALHALFRKEFLLTSYDPDFARTARLPVKTYEVLLALSLGVAVSLALKVAGILLVFAFLAISPVAGLTLGRRLAHAKIIALGVAASSSLLGWIAATRANLPVSPTIACFLVLHAAVAAAIGRWRNPWLVRGFHGFVATLATLALAAAVHVTLRKEAPRPLPVMPAAEASKLAAKTALLATYRSAISPDTIGAATRAVLDQHDGDLLEELIHAALGREEDAREATFDALAKATDTKPVQEGLEKHLGSPRLDVRLHAAIELTHMGDARGVALLLDTLASSAAPPGTREEAVMGLLKAYPEGEAFGYDPFKGQRENEKAVLAWNAWWRTQKGRVLEGNR
jgi:zinc transport system permease protein